jgi:hypothetical protein
MIRSQFRKNARYRSGKSNRCPRAGEPRAVIALDVEKTAKSGLKIDLPGSPDGEKRFSGKAVGLNFIFQKKGLKLGRHFESERLRNNA